MEMGNLSGQMVRNTMESGRQAKDMVKARCGALQSNHYIKAVGEMVFAMVKES